LGGRCDRFPGGAQQISEDSLLSINSRIAQLELNCSVDFLLFRHLSKVILLSVDRPLIAFAYLEQHHKMLTGVLQSSTTTLQ